MAQVANAPNLTKGKILAVKGAKISDYRGKSLNSSDVSSALFTDLTHKDTEKLQAWFDEQCNLDDFRSLTEAAPERKQEQSAPSQRDSKSNLNLICEVKNSDPEEAAFFFINGQLNSIKNDDRMFYLACPKCCKKVTEENGSCYCENCAQAYPKANPTYMITAKVSDPTENIFVSFTRDQGTALMGITAEDFKKMRETKSEEEVQAFLDSLLFKPMNLMVRGKPDYYNGESRMKFFAVKVYPKNVVAENRALLARLSIYDKM
jgi:replication factor A1